MIEYVTEDAPPCCWLYAFPLFMNTTTQQCSVLGSMICTFFSDMCVVLAEIIISHQHNFSNVFATETY